MGAYKTFTTKRINQILSIPGTPFWQRSFYDHIIRNESDLDNIRSYLRHNPLKWDSDRENPQPQSPY